MQATWNRCHRDHEVGIDWTAVRLDLTHVIDQVLEGALSRDLHASKDSGGRDPAISYGDVQLQRHLERFKLLAQLVPKTSGCSVGRLCVQLFVSVLFSGLQWGQWFLTQGHLLESAVHEQNWTGVVAAGWPLLEVLGIVAELHGGMEVPPDCLRGSWGGLATELLAEEAESLLQNPPCRFARAVATATLALSAPRGAEQLGSVQTAVRHAVADSQPLAFLAPPLPSLLMKLADVHGRRRGPSLSDAHTDIIYCGHLEIEEELESLCQGTSSCRLHMHRTDSVAASRRECYPHYRSAVQGLQARATLGWLSQASVLLVSPLTWQWSPELARDLRRLLAEQSRWRQEVALAGLPVLNRSRIWVWPVQRVRQRFWKLAFEEYATGHETAPYMPLAQFWAVGDTTSSSRVYSTRELLALERELSRREAEYPASLPGRDGELRSRGAPEDVSEWFVSLDILATDRGLRAYTLLQGSSQEDDYKARAKLSSWLSQTFHVEAARFLSRGPQQSSCLFRSSAEASAFTRDHGVVVSWCTRLTLRNMFQVVGSWWLALNPRAHVIVPVSASVLNIFRSGDLELFPWDADIDANFIASYPIVVGSFLETHRAALEGMGYTYMLRGDRAVISDLADSARMDIWISGPQDIVGYDIRARLCGVRVNFFREQLEGTVWYYRPGEKIYGNTQGRLLHCRWPGHNACLPDCVRGGLGVGPDGCEFRDRFVHLDT